MAEPVAVTDADFEAEVLQAKEPVLVDFWAEWCGPCKAIAPHLHQIAVEQEGKLKVAKVDVDSNLATARKYGVMSIPTLILFKGGKPVEKMTGARSKDGIMKSISPHLVVTA